MMQVEACSMLIEIDHPVRIAKTTMTGSFVLLLTLLSATAVSSIRKSLTPRQTAYPSFHQRDVT